MSDVSRDHLPPSLPPTHRLRAYEVAIMLLVSVAMCLATALEWWPIAWMETLGFLTGGICVWMVVRENMWNWPLGIANNIVFFILFTQGRLFADAGLQIVYLLLGAYGWWNWLRGGEKQTELTINRAPRLELLLLLLLLLPVTLGLRELLIAVSGAAPFWDALSTVISLIAQFLLCRKRLENWYFWIIVDVIYVPLYISRGLPLTAALYFVLLLMCLAGWRQWRMTWNELKQGTAS